ncbi:PQ-loop repeat-containing protein [Mycoplasmopsis opalescens]|uniref:PQ-loop repeat-containing protein n=1 Tax=Mycoplasmopsis opalescens TaxID=114886 RepID=UPI00068A350B|nr:PQ-loop repeat-containing protein [Mycoplasmopsis opalescens]
MNITILVLGIISSLLMVILPIPQLITTFKTKNVDNVSYPAFYIYFFGGALFVAVMTMLKKTPFDLANDPIINIVGNTLFIGLMATTITLFMVLDKKVKKALKLIGVIPLWVIFISLATWWIIEYSLYRTGYFDNNNTFITIVTIIANTCTALPFVAQIIKTLKTKSAEGVSFVLLACGYLINMLLLVYFGLLLPMFSAMWWVTLLFQSAGALVYVIQIIVCVALQKENV